MLKGESVNLRTVRSKDLEPFLDLMSDVALRGDYFPMLLPTETSIRTRFEKDGCWGDESGTMLIVDKETDDVLGMMVHFQPTHYYSAVEIGYIVFQPSARGKGICSQALTLFVDYLFKLKRIDRIQLQIEPGNKGSRRVAEKCGFTYEGTARKAITSRGKSVDIDVWSILREEFEARPG